MLRKNRKTLKIVSAVLACTFSLLTCFTGVFAWYSVQTLYDQTVDTFEITGLGIKSYSVSLLKKVGNNATKTTDLSDLSLQDWNTIDHDTPKDLNNILCFDIEFNDCGSASSTLVRNLKVVMKSKETKSNTAYDNGSGDDYSRTFSDDLGYKYIRSKGTTVDGMSYTCNFTSNIIGIKNYVHSYRIGSSTDLTKYSSSYSDINFNTATDDALFTNLTADFKDKISKEYFFLENNTKATSIEMVIQVPYKASAVKYFIQYNYSTTLWEEFISTNEFVKAEDFAAEFTPSFDIPFNTDLTELSLDADEVVSGS